MVTGVSALLQPMRRVQLKRHPRDCLRRRHAIDRVTERAVVGIAEAQRGSPCGSPHHLVRIE